MHVDGHFAQVADCQLLEIADVLEVEVAGEAFLYFLHEFLFLGEELAEEGDLWVLFEVAVDYLEALGETCADCAGAFAEDLADQQ